MVQRRWQRSGVIVAALWAAPDAFACSPIVRQMSPAQVRAEARTEYAKATAVVDAEVDIPMSFGRGTGPGVIPAGILRVIRSYKGSQALGGSIAIVYASSCDIALMGKGERVRILLMDGPELFRAYQFANSPASDREEAQKEFNAEIDRLAGAPRPAGFSTYPGEIEPPVDDVAIARDIQARNTAAAARNTPISSKGAASVGLGIYIACGLSVVLAFIGGLLLGRRYGSRRVSISD